MNNKQLDMVLGYLNEGTEIDQLSWLVESINEEINKFTEINETYFVNESVGEKVKEILNKLWKFIKSLVNKALEFVKGIGTKLTGFIAKLKAKLSSKKKESTNESVILESAKVKIPYYWCEADGEEVTSEVGALSTINNAIDEDDVWDALIDAAKFTLHDIPDDEFDSAINACDETFANIKNAKFEVRFREESTSGDPIDTKIKYANLLIADAKVLKKNTMDTDAQFEKAKNLIMKANEDVDQKKLNKYLNYLQRSMKPTADYINMQVRLINAVAVSYLAMNDKFINAD
jgi:hypothetical protein